MPTKEVLTTVIIKKFKIINTIHNRSGTKALVQIEKTYISKGKEKKVTETMTFKISNNKIYSIEYW